MRFAAAVLLAGACASVAAATGGARTTAGATLAFVSVGEDRVGTIMKNTKPDGIPDAHFRLTLDAPGETVVKMGLRSTDADGTPAFGQRWDTVYGGDWIMAVFRNDTLLNPLDSGVNDPLTGPVTYELYRMHLPAGATQTSPAHHAGVTEHVTVFAGVLRSGPLDRPLRAGPGEHVEWPADVPHVAVVHRLEQIDHMALELRPGPGREAIGFAGPARRRRPNHRSHIVAAPPPDQQPEPGQRQDG